MEKLYAYNPESSRFLGNFTHLINESEYSFGSVSYTNVTQTLDSRKKMLIYALPLQQDIYIHHCKIS